MRWTKILLGAVTFVAAFAVFITAFVGARNAARMTHCRNNLRYLGERAVELVREAHLNDEWEQIEGVRGKAFWQMLWDIKLKGKRLDLSPFACPFVAGDETPLRADELPESQISYMGPQEAIRAQSGTYRVGGDDPGDHHGRPFHVLILRLESKKIRRDEEELHGDYQVKVVEP